MLVHGILVWASLTSVCCNRNDSAAGGKNEEKQELKFKTSTSDFRKILGTTTFIDKSLLIEQLFEDDIVLITAPRRFGKSTNMDMVKTFAEIVVDGKGKPIDVVNSTDNYKIFQKLKIYKKRNQFFREHFGQYPVIYLNFKPLATNNFAKFLNSFRKVVNSAFKRHEGLLDVKGLWYAESRPTSTKRDKETFMKFWKDSEIQKVDSIDLQHSINDLSEILHVYYKQKPIVLIDEYDSPIMGVIYKASSDINEIFDFIREFISILLKDNIHVDRALINACLRLAGVLSPDANNIPNVPFLTNAKYAPYYGLTTSEVRTLALKLGKDENEIKEIDSWYDGYQVKGHQQNIYSTWSVLHYFWNNEFENYWAEGGVSQVRKLFACNEIRYRIQNLLASDNATIYITTISKLEVDHIILLRNMIADEDVAVANENRDLFLQYLLDSGYFNIVFQKVLSSTKKSYTTKIRIPNEEIRVDLRSKLYNAELLKSLFKIQNTDEVKLRKTLENLCRRESSIKQLKDAIVGLFSKSATMPTNEAEVRSSVFGAINKEPLKEVRSEVYVGANKLDLLAIRADGAAVIMEFKYYNHRLRTTAEDALQQILGKNYDKILNEDTYEELNGDKILIGLYMHKDNTLSVCCLFNSRNMSDKICVS